MWVNDLVEPFLDTFYMDEFWWTWAFAGGQEWVVGLALLQAHSADWLLGVLGGIVACWVLFIHVLVYFIYGFYLDGWLRLAVFKDNFLYFHFLIANSYDIAFF